MKRMARKYKQNTFDSIDALIIWFDSNFWTRFFSLWATIETQKINCLLFSMPRYLSDRKISFNQFLFGLVIFVRAFVRLPSIILFSERISIVWISICKNYFQRHIVLLAVASKVVDWRFNECERVIYSFFIFKNFQHSIWINCVRYSIAWFKINIVLCDCNTLSMRLQ